MSAALQFEDSFEALSRRFAIPLPLRSSSAAFMALTFMEWTVFTAIWDHLWGNATAWPSQMRIARLVAGSERSVRDAIRRLEALDILRSYRQLRSADAGGFRLFYKPGPELVRALRVLDRERPKRLAPGKMASEHPAQTPGKHLEEIEPSSCEAAPKQEQHFEQEADALSVEPPNLIEVATQAPLPEPSPVTAEDSALASELLTAHARRRRPDSPPPRWWDRSALELVALRVAELPGSRDDKLATGLWALRGAFDFSRERPPTVRFIWGTQEHFLAHAERGRLADERDQRRQQARKHVDNEPQAQPPKDSPVDVLEAIRALQNALGIPTTAPVKGGTDAAHNLKPDECWQV